MADGFNNTPGGVVDNLVGGNIGGIFSTKPSARYMSGARCVLKINNKLVGFAFGVTWKITTDQTEINTIDDYLPYEYAPRKMTVEGSISALHIPGQSAGSMFWQPNVLSFPFHQYLSIEVRDSQTDQLLFATSRAVITSRTEDIKIDQLSNVTLTWKAIGYQDELSASVYPDDKNNESGKITPAYQGPLGTAIGLKS